MADNQADLVIINGNIRSMDERRSRYSALAARGGRIAALGTNESVRDRIGPATVVVDAGGRTVLPGFTDAHTHWSLLARSWSQSVNVRTPPVQSITDIIATGRRAAAEVPAGNWIQLIGNTFQAEQLREGRLPNIHDLNSISTVHPILYRTSLHSLVLNQCALDRAGITSETVPPAGSTIGRDPKTGELNGYLAEMFGELPLPKPTREQIEKSVEDVGRELYLKNGVTSIQEFWDSNDTLRSQNRLVRSRKVPLRVQAYGWLPLAGSFDEILAGQVPGVEQEKNWFEISGIKIFVDGGTAACTAACHEDYRHRPGDKGLMVFDDGDIYEMFRKAHHAGAQVLVHAAGDRAQDKCLDAFEKVFDGAGPMWDRRHRLEHGGNVLWTAARAARCKQLGISPVPNVGFIHIYGEFWPSVFGEARARARVPLRTMLDQGFEIAGSSDTTGGDLVMMNPFHNMWAMITRRSYKGNVLDAEEAIDLDEALTVYTRNGAIAGRYLDSRGTLEIGKLADVVIASADLHAIPIDEIRHVKADCTIVDGVIAQVRPEIEGTLLK